MTSTIIRHIHATKPLLAKIVGGLWYRKVPAVTTEITVQTVFTVCMWISNRVAADDNPMKLMSIAMKPIGHPPFPIDRIEEMTRMMGGKVR